LLRHQKLLVLPVRNRVGEGIQRAGYSSLHHFRICSTTAARQATKKLATNKRCKTSLDAITEITRLNKRPKAST
jgi:hypothetical protein